MHALLKRYILWHLL